MAIKRMTKEDLPQSLGAFKPVGHVLMGLHSEDDARGAVEALRHAGFAQADIIDFDSAEYSGHMERMIDHASDFAGFGYEITLMRRYRQLCAGGCRWLLVYAPEEDAAQRVADVARRFHALTAVKYHRLAEEDLITPA
jgi:hypothetical protein